MGVLFINTPFKIAKMPLNQGLNDKRGIKPEKRYSFYEKNMQKITNVEDAIRKTAGPEGLRLFNALKNKKNVSEFKLAESLGLEINVVRNLLYKLYHANLVSFTRKKDKQKGWYIYYWTLKAKRLSYLIGSLKKESLEIMKEKLKKEKNNFFFMCKNNCVRLNFDHAVDLNYKCPECGDLMQQMDNKEKILDLEKDIGVLEKEMSAKAKQIKKTADRKTRIAEKITKKALKKNKKK